VPLSFRNREVKKLFEAETDEVKQEVEDFRESMDENGDGDVDDDEEVHDSEARRRAKARKFQK
jgi:hypothetical protein